MQDKTNGTSARNETMLRDDLAAARTVLANERTLLAYVRTALSLIAAGAFFVKFIALPYAEIAGWGLMFLGAAAFVLGATRFQHMRRRLARMRQH